MRFRVLRDSRLFASVNGTKLRLLFPNEIVTATGDTDGDFMKVEIGDGTQGWVLKADCIAVSTEERTKLDPPRFVRACLRAERTFNVVDKLAPWLVSADYILARALIETEMQNLGPRRPGSDAAGPLQVSSLEWKSFLKNGGSLAKGFDLADFDLPYHQVSGAAHRMHEDAKNLSATRTAAGVGTADDPYVPSFLDLLVAYLLGDANAASAVLASEQNAVAAAKSVEETLQGTLDEGKLDLLFSTREGFVGERSDKRSVKDFLAATEARLGDALKKAFELIEQHMPEELPRIRPAEAPWMEVAEQQLADGVREPDPIIKTYFSSTNFGSGATSRTHWCGAFVAHCLANCGSPQAKSSIPKDAAVAAKWKGWGTQLPVNSKDIPKGAVVVFKPGSGSGTSGHVAFFNGYDEHGRILALGGNQSDAVSSKHMGLQVAYIGWLDLGSEMFAEQFTTGAPSGTGQISDRAFNLIVEFEVTNKQNYEQRLRRPIWPGVASGVTIGIGYDVGQTALATFRADWAGLLPSNMLKSLEGAVGVKGPAARPLADKLAKTVIVPWDSAIKVHRDKVIPRWIKVVETHLPNASQLSHHSLGALVSLTYNRGPSFNKAGDRYAEMRNIKAHMANGQFKLIPAEIRSMKRLWPTVAGLRRRRDTEAQFFEDGL